MENSKIQESWRWRKSRKRFQEMGILSIITIALLVGETMNTPPSNWRLITLLCLQTVLSVSFFVLYHKYRDLIKFYDKDKDRNFNTTVSCIRKTKKVEIVVGIILLILSISMLTGFSIE